MDLLFGDSTSPTLKPTTRQTSIGKHIHMYCIARADLCRTEHKQCNTNYSNVQCGVSNNQFETYIATYLK